METPRLCRSAFGYTANFDENMAEIIEFNIMPLSKDGLHFEYCDHIYGNYYKKGGWVGTKLTFTQRREVRFLRKIVENQENKDLLGKDFNMVFEMLKFFENKLGMKHLNPVEVYYWGLPDFFEGEIIVDHNKCYITRQDGSNIKFHKDKLATFLKENKLGTLSTAQNLPILDEKVLKRVGDCPRSGYAKKTSDYKRATV